MHVLGHYGKDNAAAIFELFLECMPEYPLDKPDNEGNTGTEVGLITAVNNEQVSCCYPGYKCNGMTKTSISFQFCSWPT